MATERLDVTVAEDNGATARLTAAVERLATAADTLQRSSDNAAGGTRRAGDAAAQSANQHNTLQRAMGGATNSFNLLASAAGAFGVTLSIKGLIDYADGFTAIQNRLKLVTKNHTELAAATKEVFRVSQETRTSVQTNAGIYARLTDSLKSMNRSTAEAAPLLKTLTQAVQLSGSGTQTAAAGLEQLQQAFGSGTLRGQEFNSVMLNINAVAKVIADGLGKPIGQLRALAQAGQLSSKVVIDALQKQASVVDRAFAQTTFSITSAIVVFNNAMTMYVGQSNSASSATGLLTRSILFFADNINVVAPILAGFIALLALGTIAGAISAIATLTAQLFALGSAALAAAVAMGTTLLIPIGLLAVAAVAVYGAFKMWGDYFVKLTTDIPVLGAAVAYLNSMINGNKTAAEAAADAKGKLKGKLDEVFQSIGTYTGAAGGAQKATHGMGGAARGAADEFNQLGEKIRNGEQIQKDHTKAQEDYNKKIDEGYKKMQFYTTGVNAASGASSGLRVHTQNLSSSVAELTANYGALASSMNGYFNVLQQAVTASQGIGPTIELMERYGNVGQAAFDKIAGAANRASSAIRNANSSSSGGGGGGGGSGSGSVFGGDSVNSLISGYQKTVETVGGGTPVGDLTHTTTRNGQVINTTQSNFEVGPRGVSINTNLAYEANEAYKARVAALDEYLSSLTNFQFKQAEQRYSAIRTEQLGMFLQADADKGRLPFVGGNDLNGYKAANSNSAAGGMRAFAQGGSFMVGGNGGTDSQDVRFKASPNERVTVETPAQQRRSDRTNDNSPSAPPRSVTNIINLAVKDTDSVRKTRRQGYQDFLRDLSRRA